MTRLLTLRRTPFPALARVLLLPAALVGLMSCGGGGDASGPTERAEGVYTGFSTSGNLDWALLGGDSAGGVGAGGDGDGGVGAGGDFGQFRNALMVVKYPDGTPVGNGQALTDTTSGMVTIKPRRGYQGPLYLELRGGSDASYYEEGKDAFVPFPADKVIRVWIPRIDKNIGITPFTEAAYRLLTEGSTPEKAAGPVPTAAEISAANDKVRTLLNQQFPKVLAVDDITRLPYIKSPSVQGQISTNPRGVYGLVNGAFSKQAAMFNPGEPAPTLAAINQLGEDLLDGKLDGLRDAQPAVGAARRTYDPNTLTGELTSALAEQSARFGTQDAIGLLPKVINFGNSRYAGYLFDASLKPGGEAITTVAGWVSEDKEGRPLGSDRGRKIPGRVFGVFANLGHGGVFLKADASNSQSKLYGFGDNIAGELGDGTTGVGTRGNVGNATEIAFPTTAVVTHLAGGFAHTVARMADGTVYTWGDNSYSQLGQGVGSPALIRAETPVQVTLPLPAIAVAASNTASYALLEDGRVFSWGSSWGFGLLGDGVKDSVRNTPAAVMTTAGELTGVVQITARDNDAMVTRRDGSVWTWGSFPSDVPFGYTEGDVAGAYKGGSPFPTQITGLALKPGVQIRKILAEQGLFVVLTDDGAVYTWGVHFDITAQAILRDTSAVQVLGLPRVRDLMPGGFIGYGSRPFDRLTGMAIDYNGNMWKVRGRVAEQFDPANPAQQRRPQGQAPRPDCATCHLVLTEWPLTPPAATTTEVCQPPSAIHGAGATLLLHADTPCEQCHNPARTVSKPSFTDGWLNCVRPTDLPPRSLPTAPASLTNSCSVPPGHVFTPQGTVCSSCHNSIIARPLQSLPTPCAQPQSTELPLLTTTAAITSARNDANVAIPAGSATSDPTPTLVGTLSAGLGAGQAVVVRRNGTVAGSATANSTSWTFTDTSAGEGSRTYSARVEAGATSFGPTSNTYTVVVDTIAPAANATITAAQGDGVSLGNGSATSDTTPSLTGTLSASPATGELLRVLRNGTQIGSATVTGTAWAFTEAAGLPDGSYNYTARLVDAAGNLGALSSAWTVIVNTSLPTAAITSAFNDQGVVIAAGASTVDTTPRLQGTLSAALLQGQVVTALRGGTALAGSATVTGTSWTYTDPGAGNASHSYTARVDQGGLLGQPSAAYAIVVDTVAPTQTVAVTGFFDQFSGTTLPPGSSSSDSTPNVNGTLSALLGTGEVVRVTRTAPTVVALGNATVGGGGLTWNINDTVTASGTYSYQAQVIDAAGNTGPASSVQSITIDLSTRTAAVTAAYNNSTGANVLITNGATSDTTPRLEGTLNLALLAGQGVTVLRDGVAMTGAASALTATTWFFVDPGATGATHAYTARVDTGATLGTPGAGITLTVDTTAPTQTLLAFSKITSDIVPFSNVTGATAESALGAGSISDTTPRIVVTLSAALAATTSPTPESIVITRNNGAITPSSTTCPAGAPANSFCFTEQPAAVTVTIPTLNVNNLITNGPPATAGLPSASVTYRARVRDAAGNLGPESTFPALVVDYVTCSQTRATAASSGHGTISYAQRLIAVPNGNGIDNCQGCHQATTPAAVLEGATAVTQAGTLVPVPSSVPTYWCRRPQ